MVYNSHESYEVLISLSLDGMLSREEQEELRRHVQTCAVCADTLSRLKLVDAMFRSQPVVSPPAGFTANVLSRIEAYETRRRWYPWLVMVLISVLVAAIISVLAPALFFSLGLYRGVESWPVIGLVFSYAVQTFGVLVSVATLITDALVNWLTLLSTQPAALAVVVTALALASTWIGLLEASKSQTIAEAATQSQSA
jgi:anti-sigma factor RsiW